MKFVMVTTSQDYWDRLAGNTGMFSEAVVQDSILEDLPKGPVNTIFIKKNPQTRKFERAWIGRCKNFKRVNRQDRDYLTFEIEGLKRYDCPEVLRNKTVGCHVLTERISETHAPAEPQAITAKENIPAAVIEQSTIQEFEEIAVQEAPKFIPFSKRQNGYVKDMLQPLVKDVPTVEEAVTHTREDEPGVIPLQESAEDLIAYTEPATSSNILQPAFFNSILKTTVPAEFESFCFSLMRLLGIHDIHRPVNHTGNEAFGFFRFNTLSTIYSTTLMPALVQENPMIIDHYFNLLRKEKIRFNNVSYSLKDTQKHIWLICRGDKTEHIRTEDGIKLKLIPVQALIALYDERLKGDAINLDAMWEKLKNL